MAGNSNSKYGLVGGNWGRWDGIAKKHQHFTYVVDIMGDREKKSVSNNSI